MVSAETIQLTSLATAEFGRSNFCIGSRCVQIRSESDRILSDFGTKIFISDRIDKVVS